MLGRQLGDEVQRDAGGPRDRFVFVPDQARQSFEKIFRADHGLAMFRADGARHLGRVTQFAEAGFAISNGERLDPRIRVVALHKSGDGAGIDAAAQEHAERHVAHPAHLDRFFQATTRLGHPLALVELIAAGGRRNVPVAFDADVGGVRGQIQRQMMPWHELANITEQRAIAARISESQNFRERRFVERRGNGGMLEQRLDFRSEGEQAPVPVIIERLDAQAIARAEQSAPAAVPDGEGEHASELVEAAGAALLVGVQDGLGVGARAVAMARPFERRAQIGMVVDFAVIDDPQVFGFVG
jgi:hypothetical protein